MKVDVRVNMKNLKYYLDNCPYRIKLREYDRIELIALCQALIDEYIKIKKSLDTFDN